MLPAGAGVRAGEAHQSADAVEADRLHARRRSHRPGKTIYIAGQIAFDKDGNVVGAGDMKAQAEQVFKNLQAALDAAGAKFSDVVKMNTYITDMTKAPAVREVRARYFGDDDAGEHARPGRAPGAARADAGNRSHRRLASPADPMEHAFTVGVEEEFQIVDPETWELRSHVSELLASSAPAFGDQVKREMHQSIVEVGTKICANVERAGRGNHPQPPRSRRRRGARRPAHRRRRHASVLELDGPGHLAGRALREHRRGAAAAGAVAADLRPARPRRRARSLDDDRADERGALFPAAPAGAVDQLAVLDGARHRPEVVSAPRCSAAFRAPASPITSNSWARVRAVRRTCSSSCTASTTARRSGGTCGRTRPSARSSSASATCRRAARDDRDRRAGAGDHRQAVSAARAQPRLPPLPPRADRREQVARRPLGHRRQADRLRQARARCRCASSRWSCSSSSTTWWTSWAAGGRSSTCSTILTDGTSAERQLQVYRETGDLRAVVRSLVDETRDERRAVGAAYSVSTV